MDKPTPNACPHCGALIARTRRTCGSEACLAVESSAWLARRRALRESRPKPTSRGSLSLRQRREVHERSNWTCHLCGYPIDRGAIYPDIEAAVVDHVVPLAQGGSNEPDNLASAHSWCNLSKGRRALADVL